jgi:hypothetical protein
MCCICVLNVFDRLNDHHDNFVFQNYGRAMLDHLPSPAIVLVNGDINKYGANSF